MNIGIVLKSLGRLLIIESIFLIFSLIVSLYYQGSDTKAFVISIIITCLTGIILNFTKPGQGHIRYREGFMIVGLGWLLISIFGSFPFLLAGTFDTFVNAFFETVSGFTTTGATVLVNIEAQPHGILFWRSFTHWLGGMGILVFTLALLPAIGRSNVNILNAESPGPTPSKLVPRLAKTARILYIIYLIFTIVEIISLKIAGMPLFDSITHTFATMGTGGFSTKNASVGAFDTPSFEWIILFFMFLAGVNFSLYFSVFAGNIKSLFKDREFQFYFSVIIIAIILIIINITAFWGDLSLSVREASFQVVSIVSTTGFTTLDYSSWPQFSKMTLFILMFFGGCAGSTGGAIKHIRILVVFKYIKRELYKLIHPNSVIAIRVGGSVIPEKVIQNIVSFVFIYLILFVSFSLILLTQNMDMLSSTSAVAATLGNVGPGFGDVGPAMNYYGLSTFVKYLLSFAMILGRLEIYTVLIMFTPFFWKD